MLWRQSSLPAPGIAMHADGTALTAMSIFSTNPRTFRRWPDHPRSSCQTAGLKQHDAIGHSCRPDGRRLPRLPTADQYRTARCATAALAPNLQREVLLPTRCFAHAYPKRAARPARHLIQLTSSARRSTDRNSMAGWSVAATIQCPVQPSARCRAPAICTAAALRPAPRPSRATLTHERLCHLDIHI